MELPPINAKVSIYTLGLSRLTPSKAKTDQPHLARALWRLAEAHWWQREYQTAQVCFSEAYALAQQLGDTEVRVWVLKDLGQTAYFMDDREQAQHLLQSAVELAAALNDKIALGWVHFDLARVQLALGQYPNATQHNQAALELFEQSGHKAGIRASRIELQLAALSGKLEEAREALIQNHQAVLESRENDSLFDLLVGDAVLLKTQGRKEAATELVLYILARPQKDNPFAHVRAKQILQQLETELSTAQIAHARVLVSQMDLQQIAELLKTL